MKKIVLLVAFLFLVVGCSELEMDSPTKKVEAFLNKYQTHDNEVINEFDVTMFEEENLTDEQKERYKEIMLNQYKDLTYKIKEEKIDGNKAKVEVEIEKEYSLDVIGETKLKVQVSKLAEDEWLLDEEIDNNVDVEYLAK